MPEERPGQKRRRSAQRYLSSLAPWGSADGANARALLKRLFFDPKRYDLGRVGRYKINQKLGIKDKEESRILTKDDLVAATKYLLRLKKGEGSVDDIDHLGSRRIRTVGELLANQCRVGLARTERLVKERMTLFDQSIEQMMPQKLINPKALSAVIRDFFGRSQLSQFMDQINPLAELTHKRRLSALGPGGLSRDPRGLLKSATFIRRITDAFVRLKLRKVQTSASLHRSRRSRASTISAFSKRLIAKSRTAVSQKKLIPDR